MHVYGGHVAFSAFAPLQAHSVQSHLPSGYTSGTANPEGLQRSFVEKAVAGISCGYGEVSAIALALCLAENS